MKPQPSANILVIDDDPDFHSVIRFLLSRHNYKTQCVKTWAEAQDIPGADQSDAILLDRHLGGLDGIKLMPRILAAWPGIPIILVTSDAKLDTIVEAIKAGALDFIGKPLDESRLFATIAKAVSYRQLQRELQSVKPRGPETFEGMIGSSPAMRTIFEVIRNVGPTSVNVMISGESGTGKELVARAVHQCSDRKSGPFIALNMAGLPGELIESTLFGHEKGAFTGAERRHPGACEEAQGGTLFLDEVTEMPLELQPKLLRFLQEKTFRRVGGAGEITADVRIVSATNRDPLVFVKEQKFRLDLYYRLNVVPIVLPPLRERRGDVSVLALAMLRDVARKYRKQFEGISPDALRRLEGFDWPGNIRQLKHLIERVVVLNDGTTLEDRMLPAEFFSDAHDLPQSPVPSKPAAPQGTPAVPAASAVFPAQDPAVAASNVAPVAAPTKASDDAEIVPFADLERRAILHAIERCGGSPAKAAQRLGISTATVYRKLKEYEIDPTTMTGPA